jgi:protein-disulfide isomerase
MPRLLALLALAALGISAQTPARKAARPAKAPATAPAAKQAAEKPAFDKVKFEAYVRHLMLWGPHIGVKVSDPGPSPMPGYSQVTVTGSYQTTSQDEIFYLSGDGSKIVRGTVYDLGQSPFAKELALLKTDLQPSLGTPGAPVVIVMFSDFECGYCREEAKAVRANLIKTYPKDVRLYFKDLPLEQIHPWARPAAEAGRCVFRQEPAAFWDYHDWIFDKQSEITAENFKSKVAAWVQTKGLDAMQFSRCIETRSTQAEVQRSIDEAHALKLNSTPTLYINGRPMSGGLPWAQLKAIIDFELDHAQKTGQGGEKCCTVQLPVPGK